MDESAVMLIKKTTETVVAISGPMTIDRIGELRTGLLEAFELGREVQLSLAGVTRVDLTGLQLLCSAHRTSMLMEVGFSVTGGDGEQFLAAAELAGMLRHVGCAQDTGGNCIWKRGV